MALVVATTLARVLDKANQIGTNDHLDVAPTTSDYLDVMALKLVLGTLAHIACKHHTDAHSLHIGSDARFATASLWRLKA